MTLNGAQAELDNLLHFWDLVNQEDIAIVGQVQLGLATSAAYNRTNSFFPLFAVVSLAYEEPYGL